MREFPMAVCKDPLARAFEMLEVDSDFETGQNPPLVFFFGPCVGSAEGSLCVTVMVELAEPVEERDDDELLLWTVLRWGMNILDTSSVLMAENPPPPPLFIPFQLSLEIF